MYKYIYIYNYIYIYIYIYTYICGYMYMCTYVASFRLGCCALHRDNPRPTGEPVPPGPRAPGSTPGPCAPPRTWRPRVVCFRESDARCAVLQYRILLDRISKWANGSLRGPPPFRRPRVCCSLAFRGSFLHGCCCYYVLFMFSVILL